MCARDVLHEGARLPLAARHCRVTYLHDKRRGASCYCWCSSCCDFSCFLCHHSHPLLLFVHGNCSSHFSVFLSVRSRVMFWARRNTFFFTRVSCFHTHFHCDLLIDAFLNSGDDMITHFPSPPSVLRLGGLCAGRWSLLHMSWFPRSYRSSLKVTGR